ncbi:MAG: DNA repair protein RadA [Cyclobacteriaceae bacterium]|nr:DNA repair protein RadA [Cyclobacteriaceae bacterium]
MAKEKTFFVCQNCGVNSPKWLGKCPSCGEWNSFVEEVLRIPASGGNRSAMGAKKIDSRPVLLKEVTNQKQYRFTSGDHELDRVLGNGIVPGSVILIGGDPGIGKSTLMLQIALKLSGKKILYVSGEESPSQIRYRAERIGELRDNCYILSETSLDDVFAGFDEIEPEIVIIDSIQTLNSSYLDAPPGTVSQIRQCTGELMGYAKKNHVPVFLIGHINKDGNLAGPKVLEHMVDTVLQFEGDRHHIYRILRSIKNRFGSTSELGIYEMHEDGLHIVDNPSSLLLSQRDEPVSGMAVGSTVEGVRPLLVEVQALVSPATFGTPQRSSTGFEFKRLNMLLAVLEKRAGFRLGIQDVFLNLTGGIKVEDPALDLAVCMSVISSYQEVPIAVDTCFAAEIGLSGELRAVNRLENRIFEAEKQGFKKIIISKYSPKNIKTEKFRIEILMMARIDEVIRKILGKF